MLSMGSRCPSLTLSTASALSSVARRDVPSPEWRKHPSGPLLMNRRNFPKLWYCRPFLPCPFVDDLWWLATLPHQLLSPKDGAYCAALLSCLMWAAWLIDSLGPCVNIFDGARLYYYMTMMLPGRKSASVLINHQAFSIFLHNHRGPRTTATATSVVVSLGRKYIRFSSSFLFRFSWLLLSWAMLLVLLWQASTHLLLILCRLFH